MLSRVPLRRASLLSEILEKFSSHRGAGSQWMQETQYEYRLNPDGKSATVGGTIRGEARRSGAKEKETEAYAGIFGGEVDEQGNFKTGGLRKYFRDEKGREKTEAKGDEQPEKYLEKLGLESPEQLANREFPSVKTKSLGEIEDVMEDLLTPPRPRRHRALAK